MAVTNHYKDKLGKEEVKRLSKEVPCALLLVVIQRTHCNSQVTQKAVRGDYKAGVKDPNAKLSDKHVGKLRKLVRDFMDKAV